MNQEELRKEAAEQWAEKSKCEFTFPDAIVLTNQEVDDYGNERSIESFIKGAEWEAEREKSVIEQLIAKYEDKVKSAEHLKQPKGTWGETITKSDIERLDVRIYERLTFIDDLKLLLTNPTKNK